jgi:hypothetical protein
MLLCMDFVGSKTQAAFVLSYRRLSSYFDPLYFWTFTAADKSKDWEFSNAWGCFQDRLHYVYGGCLCGLRVFERHMGRGVRRGTLHCHVIVSHRIGIGEVRRLAVGSGIGRVMWVRVCWSGMEEYLAKYMGKELGHGTGVRSWARFGPWDSVCVTNLVAHSATADLMRHLVRRREGDPDAFQLARYDFDCLTMGRRLSDRPAILASLLARGYFQPGPGGLSPSIYAGAGVERSDCIPAPVENSVGEMNPF